jgi:AcrR family transcriptional regulator
VPRPRGARDTEYQNKRRALLHRISARLMQREGSRASLRQMADAAEVTVPTLRHYFGSRREIILAMFEEYRRTGEPHLQREAQPTGPFPQSVRDCLRALVTALRYRPVGDMFAVAMVEGLLHEEIGPASLAYVIDPSIDAIEARLKAHQARGEMRPADARNAAIMLISPMLLATQHQRQLHGAADRPLALEPLVEDVASAFVKAYAA